MSPQEPAWGLPAGRRWPSARPPPYPPLSSRESGACLRKANTSGWALPGIASRGSGRGSGQTPADPEATESAKAGLGDPTQVRKWEGGGQCARADGQAHWEMWWLLLNPHVAISLVGRPRELPKEAHPWAGVSSTGGSFPGFHKPNEAPDPHRLLQGVLPPLPSHPL